MSPSDHHAAGPALGYVYQCEAALLELLPHALVGREAQVTLEVFDDVSFDFGAGQPRSVLQIHHSVQTQRELLDTSAKAWRTIAIWADEWRTLGPGETRAMTLLTTQLTRDGSALRALTREARDVPTALRILVSLASDANGAAGTAVDRANFAALGPEDQRALLDNVTVVDGAVDASGVRRRLEELLAPTHEHRFIASMADALEGWWWPRVIDALANGSQIGADEARIAIDEARRSLSERALPILRLEDFEDREFPALDPAAALFLLCLHEISASVLRLDQALNDYRRTFAHRSRWARRGLLGPGEYERYEDDLFEQWLIASDRMLRNLPDDADDVAAASAGHDLWDGLESDVRRPLRPETGDSFIQRGSFHQLANDQRIAWHPAAAAARRAAHQGDEAAA